jgi:hypothetical protein
VIFFKRSVTPVLLRYTTATRCPYVRDETLESSWRNSNFVRRTRFLQQLNGYCSFSVDWSISQGVEKRQRNSCWSCAQHLRRKLILLCPPLWVWYLRSNPWYLGHICRQWHRPLFKQWETALISYLHDDIHRVPWSVLFQHTRLPPRFLIWPLWEFVVEVITEVRIAFRR